MKSKKISNDQELIQSDPIYHFIVLISVWDCANHSTTFQLIDIYHHICQTFDNEQFSCIVLCDISKAFDRVWHKGLQFKLEQNGIIGSLLDWTSDYLKDRSQRVVIRSCVKLKICICWSSPRLNSWAASIVNICK